jgi:hypothetical protein
VETLVNGDLDRRFVRRLRIAGSLVVAGLAIQALTLLNARPVSFITFLVGGAGLVMAGLFALVWAYTSSR